MFTLTTGKLYQAYPLAKSGSDGVILSIKYQNKDSLATQIKLNELITTHTEASNRLLNVEDLSEEELRVLHKFFGKLADKAKQNNSLTDTHSLAIAEELHQDKQQSRRVRRGLT